MASSRGAGAVRLVGRQDVDPPALRVLVADPLALARQGPAVAGRQRRGEAALVEVVQLQPPGRGPFFEVVQDRLGPLGLGGVLLVLEGVAVRR